MQDMVLLVLQFKQIFIFRFKSSEFQIIVTDLTLILPKPIKN